MISAENERWVWTCRDVLPQAVVNTSTELLAGGMREEYLHDKFHPALLVTTHLFTRALHISLGVLFPEQTKRRITILPLFRW